MLNYAEHILASLAEEAGEVVHMVGKCLRFMEVAEGLVLLPDDKGEGDCNVRLGSELNDLMAVMELLNDLKIVPNIGNRETIDAKKQKTLKYWNQLSGGQ
jgi:hypothetical protein